MEENEVNRTNTLLDTVILEGKADLFCEIIFPDIYTPWSEPLSENLENETRKILMNNLSSIDSKINEEFYNGNPNRGICNGQIIKLETRLWSCLSILTLMFRLKFGYKTPALEILLKKVIINRT